MIDIEQIRHPKEKTYYTVLLIITVLIYILLLPLCFILLPFVLLWGPLVALIVLVVFLIQWFLSLRFKAQLYGDSVLISPAQYADVFQIAAHHAQALNIDLPPVFVRNSQGTVNAAAIKFFLSKYVILESSLVDLMLSSGRIEELSMIIGHELGHHAAGHLSFSKRALTGPAKAIPILGFLLALAYSRACEYTCDRVGHTLGNNLNSSQQALYALALGSKGLLKNGNTNAFASQENDIPEFAGFVNKILSTHPRTTLRVIELGRFAAYSSGVPTNSHYGYSSHTQVAAPAYGNSFAATGATRQCAACGNTNNADDAFCFNCGNSLLNKQS